jgi:hypothetical protein
MPVAARTLAFAAVIATLSALAPWGGARAQGAGDAAAAADVMAPGRIEEQLKAQDPATVAAARVFAKSYNMSGMVQKSAPFLVQSVDHEVRTKNPGITDDQAQAFVSAFLANLFEDNGRTLEEAAVLTLTEIMNKDELDALIQFQSTPVGASALKKMPTLSARLAQIMPLMQTYVVPQAMKAAQAQMRKGGVEVKI